MENTASKSCTYIKMLCKVVPFNLHGLNNGKDMLYQICDDAVEEHWLTNDKLHLHNSIHPDFIAFGLSGMSKLIALEIYVGRPFGGVAFLCRKYQIKFLSSDHCS
jgi:hypothetical protein